MGWLGIENWTIFSQSTLLALAITGCYILGNI